MEKYSDKTIELNEKDKYNDMFTKEEDDALLYKSGLESAYDEGIEQGVIQTAKNMLKKNMDIKMICEVTCLEMERLKDLISDL